MEITINESTGTAARSHLLVPVFRGTTGGVCPQAGRVRAADYAAGTTIDQVSLPTAAAFGGAMGVRSWSPLIT